MVKLAVPINVAFLQHINIWVNESRASVHCRNDRAVGINIHESGSGGTVGMHNEAMTANNIMDINKLGATKSARIG